ncbi:MAG: MBL fold metallo-hydrolase [Chloroflexi bacterium]|nr:MAG: MBL fold metallo-hydrolase [Chloroflexota bacterium]
MVLERIFTPGLAQVAYLIGDPAAGVAAVIDPRRDVDSYIALAQQHGLRITAIFETHVHADFVSGALELADHTGATIYASRIGASEFKHQPLDDGDVINVGKLKVQAFWTPGHTPEHMSYLLTDPVISNKPQALFSGDMLFVGTVGRPDLLGSEATEGLLEQLYDSVYNRLMHLPDDIIVYPGHGAGSACGKNIGDNPSTTIGQEKRFNYAFRFPDREAFREVIMEDMPPAPTYYPYMKRVNKVGPALLRDLPEGGPLDLATLEARMQGGALLIDTRSSLAFGGAHIPGAVFAGLGNNFVNWAGWHAPYERDVILLLDDDSDYAEARTELLRIGIDRVAGYVQGGFDAWVAAGKPVLTLPQISVHALHERLESNNIQVLDVRTEAEWRAGHIPGARQRFAGDIVKASRTNEVFANGLSDLRDAPVAVICASGYRSTVAASVLQGAGHPQVLNVVGGADAWQAAGYPLKRGNS